MLTGIALLGVVTAAVAAWFVNVVRTSATAAEVQAAANEIDVTDQISALITKMDTMHAELAAMRAQLQAG